MQIKHVCICGGGALGTVCATLISNKGYSVSVLTGHPQMWEKNITVIDSCGETYKGVLNTVSQNPQATIQSADMVLLTVPGFLIRPILDKIKPFLKQDTLVGSIVSSTGFFFQAHELLNERQPLFGFQRVPFIARVIEYGKSASLLGYKKHLFVALENIMDEGGFLNILEDMFLTPVQKLPSFYEASLSNSNPLLHTARLYSLFNGKENKPCDKPILFYEEWNDTASELLIEMDNEFLHLLDLLKIEKMFIPSITQYYEVSNAHELTKKIQDIPAFKGIKTPMVVRCGKWYPDFNSRYFTEDFPYGLKFIYELGKDYQLIQKKISEVYAWGIKCIMTHN